MQLPSPTVETLLDGYSIGSDQGSIAFCSVNLIEGPDERGMLRRIVVDTGHTGRRPALDTALLRRDLGRTDIDIVVCTHAHWDHIENLDIFTGAELMMHPDERRYLRRPHPNDFACPEWVDAVFERYEDRVRVVDEGTRIIPGVEIVAAPGHSAGSIAVTVATGEGTAVIAGDSIQNSMVAQERTNALVFWNDQLARRTIDKLLAVADIVFPGHDRPFRVSPSGQAEYLREFQLTLTGIPADQPGLGFRPNPGFQQIIMDGIEEQRLPD